MIIDAINLKQILRDYEQYYANKFEILDEQINSQKNTSFSSYLVTPEEIENLNVRIIINPKLKAFQ